MQEIGVSEETARTTTNFFKLLPYITIVFELFGAMWSNSHASFL